MPILLAMLFIATTVSLTATPPSLAFPDQTVGQASSALNVSVSNTGGTSANITGLSFTGTNPGDFSTTATPAISVAAGATVLVPVKFTPAAQGLRSATLTVSDNSGGVSHAVLLSGKGATASAASISVSPAFINFPDQSVGVASSAVNVTVSNSGGTSAQVTGITISGANSGDFSTTAVPALTVPGGGSVTIPVKFTPGATGARSALLTVIDNSGGSNHTVSLAGNGINAQPVGVNVTPSSIVFPNQAIGTFSAGVPVTITNNTTASVQITGFLFSGTNASDFMASGARTPIALTPGQSTSVNIVFRPSGAGTRTGNFVVLDNSGGLAHSVSLSGNQPAAQPTISLTPSSLTFPATPVGSYSAAQSVQVKNTGTVAATINSLSKIGPNPTDFPYAVYGTLGSSDFPETLQPGESVTMAVFFQPSGSGTRSATFLLQDANGASLATLVVTGSP